MKRSYYLLSCLLFIFSVYSASYAASLEIAPTQLYLTAETPTAVLTLKNLNEQPILLQIHSVTWQQTAEGDDYQKTNALIINPPIVTIPPNESQVIRVGLRDKYSNITQEKSYRIFITEVLPKVKREQGVNTILQINLPVFIEPAIKQGELVWKIHRINKQKLSIQLSNLENKHIQVYKISLYNNQSTLLTSQKMFTYLLPKQSKSWTFDCQSNVDEKAIKLVASTDRGDITHYAPAITP